jgi:peptidoglycan/LPS O-acetylase OafA/YrhL
MAACAALGHPVATLSVTHARVLVVATLVAVIALSAASFNYFEEPMRRLLRRRLMPSRPPNAAAVAG